MPDAWGVFDLQDLGEVHVAPCDDGGYVTNGHILQTDCPCQPEVEDQGLSILVIHDEKDYTQ